MSEELTDDLKRWLHKFDSYDGTTPERRAVCGALASAARSIAIHIGSTALSNEALKNLYNARLFMDQALLRIQTSESAATEEDAVKAAQEAQGSDARV